MGAFAARVTSELGCEVVALDSSAAMVRATESLGMSAILGDVQHLPFADETFDCAVAAWMLYHVPDRDRAIAELARVLRPGGRLVAITNGRDHLAELWASVGAGKAETTFSRENGRPQLERHFASVTSTDLQVTAVFPDRLAARSYLESLGEERVAERLPECAKPLVARGSPVVFVADKADRSEARVTAP
jgi:ubiquinone/menaquinone biosynthesis C-methylase UbiE